MKRACMQVYTIGHSNHELETFIALLGMHEITAIADVRSTPYSRFNPDFNRESIEGFLRSRGIVYSFLGHELGGRTDDPEMYGPTGTIDYDRVADTSLFRKGISRLESGIDRYRIAIMCAEKDPLDCHRSLLVGQVLGRQGLEVAHIHANGHLEQHGASMGRLVEEEGVRNDLFNMSKDMSALIGLAVKRRTQRVGYRQIAAPESGRESRQCG